MPAGADCPGFGFHLLQFIQCYFEYTVKNRIKTISPKIRVYRNCCVSSVSLLCVLSSPATPGLLLSLVSKDSAGGAGLLRVECWGVPAARTTNCSQTSCRAPWLSLWLSKTSSLSVEVSSSHLIAGICNFETLPFSYT